MFKEGIIALQDPDLMKCCFFRAKMADKLNTRGEAAPKEGKIKKL